ncbi:hypothetical protein AJ80_04389 [Polytolypa hystricis UAMH7299]|uniref:DUF7371 domain-containing protein n=1 Tax=Polytolypa hystricis (strain UAMH7299) TaxID=1447883 RepID=A0A2B7YCP7_POLH7|nr:hypothetical protein AJ80_04389 [Polytolypa hystricis UAMH7299]
MLFRSLVGAGLVSLALGAILPPRAFNATRFQNTTEAIEVGKVTTIFKTVTQVPETVYVTVNNKAPLGALKGASGPEALACPGLTNEPTTTSRVTVLETSYITSTKTVTLDNDPPSFFVTTAVDNTEAVPGQFFVKESSSEDTSSRDALKTVHVQRSSHVPETVTVTSTSTATFTIRLSDASTSGVHTSAIAPSINNGTTLMTVNPTTSTTSSTEAVLPFVKLGPGGWNMTAPSSSTQEGQHDLAPTPTMSATLTVQSIRTDKLLNKRQVGAIVVATINGQVVSWTNEYSGEAATSPTLAQTTGEGVVSTTAMETPASSTPTPSATSACGEVGNFSITFDDLPRFNRQKNKAELFPPIFTPYHHLSFGNGWTYTNPPHEPYTPISSPYVGMFRPNLKQGLSVARFGSGARAAADAYWFDAHSTFFGCDSFTANRFCNVTASAYRYSTEVKKEVLAATRSFSIPSCPSPRNCTLTPLSFGEGFHGLSRLQFEATVENLPIHFFLDDIKLKWHNNTCAAGKIRSQSR